MNELIIFIVIVQDNEIEMQTQGAKTTTRQYKNNKAYKTRMNHK